MRSASNSLRMPETTPTCGASGVVSSLWLTETARRLVVDDDIGERAADVDAERVFSLHRIVASHFTEIADSFHWTSHDHQRGARQRSLKIAVRAIGLGALGRALRRGPETAAGRRAYQHGAARPDEMLRLGIDALAVDQQLARRAVAAARDAGGRGFRPRALGEKRDGDRGRSAALDQNLLAVAAAKFAVAAGARRASAGSAP